MKKKPIHTVIQAIPDILKNILSWAKDNFNKHAQETLGSATGTVGVIIKLFGQSILDKYFDKITFKKLEDFGLQFYLKAAFTQANKSLETIEQELQKEISPKEVLELFDFNVTEQIEKFNPDDIILIFQPKYHPAVIFVKNNYIRILESINANQAALNAFKKHFNDHIEEQIRKEFGNDYEKHLKETEEFRLKDNEIEFLLDMKQLDKIGFNESENLKYEKTFAQWQKVSELIEKDKEKIKEKEYEKQEQILQPIETLIEAYFNVEPYNNLEKILFVIADFGKGKSIFLRQYAAKLAKNYLQVGEGWFPVYFNLRNFKNYSSEPKLGVISDFLQTRYAIKIDSDYFQKKQYVFLVDSLDESGELSKPSIDKVIDSIKRIQGINKEKYRTNRLIITSRPFYDGLEYHLRNHKPYIIQKEETRDIEYFISIYGFKKVQFNDWLRESLKIHKRLNPLNVKGFTRNIIKKIQCEQNIDIYEELVKRKTLSRSELRRPIFAYMIYQLIINNIDFSAIGKIRIYLSFLNLLTKEAKHIHDKAYQINLKEEFAFRNILHGISALWMYERQQGKQGALKKADICRVLDGENKGETDEQILSRYKNQGVVEIQFLSHSYFGEKENILHFQHQSFAEILLAEYYLKVFIKYALDEECNVDEARAKLTLGLPTEQTIQFFKEIIRLLKDTSTTKVTNNILEKRKLLFPLMASLATRKHNRLFCNEIYYEWYRRCQIKENQIDLPPEGLKCWAIDKKNIEKIIKLAKNIIESKSIYVFAKAEVKNSLYNKELLEIQNNKLNNFPLDIDRWLALLVGNELFNDITSGEEPKLFNREFQISYKNLFDLIKNSNHISDLGIPPWGKNLFRGIDMSQNNEKYNLYVVNLPEIDFSFSYLKKINAAFSFCRGCIFDNVNFVDFNFSFCDLMRSRFSNIRSIEGEFNIENSEISLGVFIPFKLCRAIQGTKHLYGNYGNITFISGNSVPTKEIFTTLNGLFIYGLQHKLFTISEIKTWFQFELEETKSVFFKEIDKLEQYQVQED